MSQGLYLDADTRCWNRQHAEPQAEAIDDFWPEVSSRYSLENPRPMNPDNAQGRVLTEIFLILAGAAALVVAAALWVPTLQ